jgi:hypothetical protein
MTALIIHGHFYQPPRENPWTGAVELEPGAAPYHDWNERIHSECYGPNAFAHIGSDGVVINNYRNISFNFGPTLLSWLANKQPRTYQRILGRRSRERCCKRRTWQRNRSSIRPCHSAAVQRQRSIDTGTVGNRRFPFFAFNANRKHSGCQRPHATTKRCRC